MKRHLVAIAVVALVGCSQGHASVRLTGSSGIYTFENAQMRIQVDAAGGARIRSWIIASSRHDLIGIWTGPHDVGGALDDRIAFTGMPYRAAIASPGPDIASLRLTAHDDTGLAIEKTLTVRGDSPAIEVEYLISNGTQASVQPFIRNIFVPGSTPLSTDHLYWVHATPSVEGVPFISDYHRAAPPEYAALSERTSGETVLAYVPGASQFYFWQGSRRFPTFEWLYPDIPAGRALRARLVLIATTHTQSPPDWGSLVSAYGSHTAPPHLSSVRGWQSEATRFHVSGKERQRGYWLSMGEGRGKRRLPPLVPLDLPENEVRTISVTLNALRDFRGVLQVDVPPSWRKRITVLREYASANRRELKPFLAEPVAFRAGSAETVWLQVSSAGAPHGLHVTPVRVSVDGRVQTVRTGIRVWPVRVSQKRPFHLRGYVAGPAALAGGAEVTPATTAHLDALLRPYAEMGGDVLDWLWGWSAVIPHVRIAGTGQLLTDAARATPEGVALDRLPRLDFSYYNPWLAVARKRGVTRVETYMEPPDSSSWQSTLLDPVLGAGRVQANTPEAARVIAWFYAEMKRWFREQGFAGFFCKISDEIAPEHIAAHIATARIARSAGWRPFTTITGFIAHTPSSIRAMRSWCDQWQLAYGSKDAFLQLTTASPGKPVPVTIKPTDELWFYGGSSYPFRGSYAEAWAYPTMAIAHGFDGYALWAYFWGTTEHIVWIDPATLHVTVSPPWCGYRDGYRDAMLLTDVIARYGRRSLERIVGRRPGSIIRIGWRTVEVYRHTTPLNAEDPLAVNAARREALRLLSRRRR